VKVINVGADLSLALPIGCAVKTAGSSGRVTDVFELKMLFGYSGQGYPSRAGRARVRSFLVLFIFL
jgi:hypothetical protein